MDALTGGTTRRQPTLVATDRQAHIALRGTQLHSRLTGMSQVTTVEQTYVNLGEEAIEAIYTFPLPEDAAVCGFEVVTGERVLTGRVEEADAALDLYDEAVSGGHAAYLLDQNRPDIFTLNVGNLKPGQAATVRTTFVAPLTVHEREIRLAFPTTVAPRYVTSSGGRDPGEAMVDGELVNPPHVLSVPYGLSLDLVVALGRRVRTVESPSHAIVRQKVVEDEERVSLAAGVTEMDRDLVVILELERDARPVAQVGTRAGDSCAVADRFVAVTFVPELGDSRPDTPEPTDVVFMLDCSGSMQGDSIAQARTALELCLRSLNPGDRFSICRFGSTFELMAEESVVYDDATLQRALEYVAHIDADLGGTELYPALEAVFGQPVRENGRRQIVLLTDGQVSNEDALIQLGRRHRATQRIFSFGIGPACSQFLVAGLARATGGAAEYVGEGERIEEKVLRTFGRMASPVFSDVAIDWGDARVRQAPPVLPPVFDGDPLTVFARFRGEAPEEVTLTCVSPAGPQRWPVRVTEAPGDGGVIATLWARAMIRHLEESSEPVATYSGARRPRRGQERRDIRALARLSKQFGLLCRHTSFVAVEHRSPAERNDGRPALRRIPVQLAKGWHGVESLLYASPQFGLADSGVAEDSAYVSACASPGATVRGKRRSGPHFRARSPKPAADAGVPPPPPVDPLLILLGTQSADGWFGPGTGVMDALDAVAGDPDDRRDELRVGAAKLAADVPVDDEEHVVDTLFTLWLLRTGFPERRRVWRRAAEKAMRWLRATLHCATDVLEQLLDWRGADGSRGNRGAA